MTGKSDLLRAKKYIRKAMYSSDFSKLDNKLGNEIDGLLVNARQLIDEVINKI